MISILILILLLLIATVFVRLKERSVGSSNFKQIGYVVLLISTIYFLLLFISNFIGGESTPVCVTTTNHLDKKIKIYIITVHDYPVYDDLSRFVYESEKIDIGDSSSTIIEYDGAVEFWTVGLDDLKEVVFFDTINSHSIYKYNFKIDKNYIADQSKTELAIADIKSYNKDKLSKAILIPLDIIFTILLLFEMITSKSKFNNLIDENKY